MVVWLKRRLRPANNFHVNFTASKSSFVFLEAPVNGSSGVQPANPSPKAPPTLPGEEEEPVEQGEEEQPTILHVATMNRNEKDKVKRICTPKPTTGNLEVPRDIYELWQTDKGKEKLFSMWCKSGGVKAGRYLVLLCLHERTFHLRSILKKDNRNNRPLFILPEGTLHAASRYPVHHHEVKEDWGQGRLLQWGGHEVWTWIWAVLWHTVSMFDSQSYIDDPSMYIKSINTTTAKGSNRQNQEVGHCKEAGKAIDSHWTFTCMSAAMYIIFH